MTDDPETQTDLFKELICETEVRKEVARVRFIALAMGSLLLALTACGGEDEASGYDGLAHYIEKNRVGSDADQWIEMKNMSGEWERTGLIFGYLGGDFDECTKAISGLKQVNYAREYRCVPAN